MNAITEKSSMETFAMRLKLLVVRAVGSSVLVAGLTSVSAAQILTPDRPTTVTIMSNGPAPQGLISGGTPAKGWVQWQPVSGAVKYTVQRSKDGDPTCCNAQSGDLPTLNATWLDLGPGGTGFQSPGTYVYSVSAWQADGRYGTAVVKWTRPDPVNPAGFTAKQTGEGTVELSWQAVPDASYYWIWGPGAPTEGVRADGTRKTLSGVGTGPKEWSITTRYDPAGFLLASSTWPKTQLNMVSTSGMYRITLNGFQVVSPTKENLITFDGAGNEVFALAYVRTYDRSTGAVLNEGSVESAVHGDTEGFAGRVPAGSAKATGGLVAGDKFPGATPWARSNSVSSTTFPLLLWEGPLTDRKDVVVVTPMIWEWQGTAAESDRQRVNTVNNDQKANSAKLWSAVSAALSGPAQTWSGPTQIPLTWQTPSWVTMAGSWAQPGVDLIIKEENRIHAIGADTPSPADKKMYYAPNIGLVFTRELIEKVLNAQSQVGGMGPGIVEVKWIEKYPGATGSYTLYLQVARQ